MHNIKNFVPLGNVENAGKQTAALVIIEDWHNRLLMQLRDADKPIVYPGCWTLFGGGVEKGETPQNAAIRELNEEIGICVFGEKLIPSAVTLSTDCRKELIYIFSVKLDISPKDICLQEGAGFAFLDRKQLEKINVIPYVSDAIEHYYSMR